MSILWQVLYLIVWLFYLLLIARLVVDFVRMFARGWMPSGRSAITVEIVYTATDPPVRMLRRVIPTVRIGGAAVDLSLLILFIVISWVLLPVLLSAALNAAR